MDDIYGASLKRQGTETLDDEEVPARGVSSKKDRRIQEEFNRQEVCYAVVHRNTLDN